MWWGGEGKEKSRSCGNLVLKETRQNYCVERKNKMEIQNTHRQKKVSVYLKRHRHHENKPLNVYTLIQGKVLCNRFRRDFVKPRDMG